MCYHSLYLGDSFTFQFSQSVFGFKKGGSSLSWTDISPRSDCGTESFPRVVHTLNKLPLYYLSIIAVWIEVGLYRADAVTKADVWKYVDSHGIGVISKYLSNHLPQAGNVKLLALMFVTLLLV